MNFASSTSTVSETRRGVQRVLEYYRCPDTALDLSSSPLDPSEQIDDLRLERYAETTADASVSAQILRSAYYRVRPALPVAVRKHMQRWALRNWQTRSFPEWPVDLTVDRIAEQALASSIETSHQKAIPFIWFWPERRRACAIMTHDVETSFGLGFCSSLMDIDESFGVKSSFQLIPEGRYRVTPSLREEIRTRGFEANIHDLNHDGRLYASRDEFLRRAARINGYARLYKANGFRSAILYRNLGWYDALAFRYDMSVPNVGHLDPQKGGCCTALPYFIGDVLELPLTTTQDYTLFHILGEYSIELWKTQMRKILDVHGLISFNIHPDYVFSRKPQDVYKELLTHLSQMRVEEDIWVALPREVDEWWRSRAEMKLIHDGRRWRIEGHGSDRAHLAYATVSAGRVQFTLENG